MKKIIAANFKTNHTRSSTKKYLLELDSKLEGSNPCEIYVLPTAASLCENCFPSLQIGAQNAYPAYKGAFSGEIGLEALEEFNIQTILIGHSERREILKETQAFCVQKFDFFASKGFKIIYCIGEDLAIRNQGLEAVMRFLRSELEGIKLDYENLILAYEPIWAIGSGVSASLESISQTHQAIKQITRAPLLYGGSVNAKNAKEILAIPEVDGVLVGSASLDLENFYQIIQAGGSIND